MIPEEIKGDLLSNIILASITVFVFTMLHVSIGPFAAGYTYILRNFSREEHAFLLGDFKEHARKNLKQSLIVSLINIIMTFLIIFDTVWFANQGKGTDGLNIYKIATILLFISFGLFSMMNMYIYPMMITVELSIKNLYKNAFIFSILKLIPNLIFMIVCFIIIAATFILSVYVGIMPLIFTASTVGIIINFHVYPTIKIFIGSS